jgi:Domain of unknown function (DUF4926)
VERLSRVDDLFREKDGFMKDQTIGVLDTVALIEDLPERRLSRGEVGTVVEILDRDVFEVEFSDEHGEPYAELALRSDQLVLLHNRGEKFKVVA